MPIQLPNRDPASLDVALHLLERLADSITDSVGYAINNVELAMEGVDSLERVSQAKMLAHRGIQELRLFLLVANFLRPFMNPSQSSEVVATVTELMPSGRVCHGVWQSKHSS